MNPKSIIVDLDGTLFVIDHRLHHVTDGNRDWDAFFACIPNDALNCDVARVVAALAAFGDRIVLCSGRPEKCRADTEACLSHFSVDYEALYMRPDDDTRPDHVVKKELLQQIRKDGYDPALVIDDRQSVVDMWREEGLTCLQCAPDVPPVPDTAELCLMVGPSGAGKSTWLDFAVCSGGISPSWIISADEVRENLWGDRFDMEHNQKTFEAIHKVVKARLLAGLPTIVDATHLRRKDRMAVAQLVDCPVKYVVVNRTMEEKYKDGGWRNNLDFDLIAKHEQTFKSQIDKDILAGDNLPNVTVLDTRDPRCM